MANVEGVGAPEAPRTNEPHNTLSDLDAMKLLGDLKESVHRVGVSMANFQPHFTPSQTFTGAFTGGVVLAMLMPPAAPALLLGGVALGVGAAIFEAGLTVGINLSGQALARLTEPPPPPPRQ